MERRSVALVSVAALFLLVACGAAPGTTPTATSPPTGSPAPTIGPLPTPADRDLSLAERKYRLLGAFGPLSYCDPDEYPVPRDDEPQKAVERFAEIHADGATFAAIVERLGLVETTAFTDDQKLAIYREWKRLNAVVLTIAVDDRAAFDLITETDPGLGHGVRTRGTIDARGGIEVDSSEATFLVSCPICLARGTLIDTPGGPIPVEQLRAGGPVWTVDARGLPVAAMTVTTGRAPVPPTHDVIHLVLDDGRELWASPGHPLSDGRFLGELAPGDIVDGALVVSADPVRYGRPFTYDLLPSGGSGLYWANGVLLGSTLH